MRRPLLMMRTRGLSGPVLSKNVGNRASHPLAHTQGNAISAKTIDPIQLNEVTYQGEQVTYEGEIVTWQT